MSSDSRHRVIVVGASSGLGRYIAQAYADRGCQVGIAARRSELLQDICSSHPGMAWREIDVTAPDAASRLQQLIADNGGMDTLVMTAGCGWNDPTLDEARSQRTVQVNALGFSNIVLEAFRYFRDNGIKGHICAITSIAGTRGIGVSAMYSATKRFEWTLLQGLDQLSHIQRLGIGITDIRPGFVDTDLLDTATRHYPMTMTVDYAGRRIVRAIDRRRRVAVIDWRWAVVTALWRLIPGWLWRRLPLKG